MTQPGHCDTIERAAIAPLMQHLGVVDCFLDGETAVWASSDDLALILTLDDRCCPTCGQRLSGRERWRIATQASIARQLFRQGYR
jgi:hypothetical protein